MIDWHRITREEFDVIYLIVLRAEDLLNLCGIIDRIELLMEIAVVHLDTPLDLNDLLLSDEIDFLHDISGIKSHIDKRSGKLLNRFVPLHVIPVESGDQ